VEIREQRQLEALQAWITAGHYGTIEGATGFGKTLVGLKAKQLQPAGAKVLIGVPTIKLRDIEWPLEAQKWGIPIDDCTVVCHASMPKMKGAHYDLVILDEGHHLTTRRNEFFTNNKVDKLIVLTATYPDTQDPNWIVLQPLAPIVYSYPLDQAVADGSVADYDIWVVRCPMDDTQKYIQGGSKASGYFMTTEKKHYAYLTKMIMRMMAAKKEAVAQIYIQKRMHFLYNLKYTKTRWAKQLLGLMEGERTIAFCGSIEQAEEILPVEGQVHGHTYHSKRDSTAYDQFCREEISQLAAVRALDEGGNYSNLDNVLIVSSTSVKRQLIQRMGRNLRLREGHKGMIIIMVAEGTKDEEWVEEALGELDRSKIHYTTLYLLLKGMLQSP
jgi:superfamily II DNA or RNA helicase